MLRFGVYINTLNKELSIPGYIFMFLAFFRYLRYGLANNYFFAGSNDNDLL